MKKLKNSRLSTDSRKLQTLALNAEGNFQVFCKIRYPISTFPSFIKENTVVYKKCECEVLMHWCICHYGVMKFDPAPLIRLFFTHW